MNRKSGEPSFQWSTIVISWVNLFQEEQNQISELLAVKDSNFFVNTIRAIFKFNGQENIPFKNTDDLVNQFIKEYFPEIIKERRYNIKNEEDILILISLLMYMTCMRYKIDEFVSKTVTIKVDDHLQEAIKFFFELMLNVEDGAFTRKHVIDTIKQCFERVTLIGTRNSLSPSVNRNRLKDILEAQMIQEFTISKRELLSELETVKHKSECLTNISSDLQQVADLSSKNETLSEELSLAVAKTEDSETQFCETKNQMNLKISELKSRLITQLQEIIHSLEVDKDGLQAQMKDQTLTNEGLTISQTELQSENQAVKCSTRTSSDLHPKQVADLSSKIETLSEELSLAVAKTIVQLCETKNQANLEILKLMTRLTELQEIIHSLELEKDELRAQIKDQAQLIQEFTVSKTELLSELETSKHKLESLTNISSDFQQQVADLSSKNETLREELSLAVAKTEEYEKQLCETRNQMNLQIKEEEKKVLDLQETIRSFEVEKEQLQKHIKDQTLTIEGLTTSETELQVKLQSANHKFEQLQQQTAILTAKNESLIEELSLAVAKTEEYEKQLCETRNQMNLQIKEEEKKVLDLQETIRSFEVEKEQLQKHIKDQVKANLITENENKELKKTVVELKWMLPLHQSVPHSLRRTRSYDQLGLNCEQDELKVKLKHQRSSIKAEYEEILAKMKLKMKSTCTRALYTKDEQHAKELKELKDVVKANQDHINQLNTNLCDTSNKLLITKNENKELKKRLLQEIFCDKVQYLKKIKQPNLKYTILS